MEQPTEPEQGHIYHWQSLPAMYVRTEQRPGAPRPEHLFLIVRDRMVSEVWLDRVPEEFKLVIDAPGRREANDLAWRLWAAEHERAILASLLKEACELLPRQRADELRQKFRDTRPERVR